MELAFTPPQPFDFENSLTNVTSGNLSREWERWKKSFNIYYEACEISKKSDKVQINILLHVIGDKCREVSEQFTTEYKNVTELLRLFDAFFIPKKNLAVERQKFFKRDQKEFESVEQYVFELNKIASTCELRDLRDDLICSRLICGLSDVALSERLLREPEINLSKALEICRLAEMSRMQAANIQNKCSSHQIHTIAQNMENNQSVRADMVKRSNKQRVRSSDGSWRSSSEQPPFPPWIGVTLLVSRFQIHVIVLILQ
ncbi:uncharacterized protein LOC131854144 [Achroia grisella]|uniref:uncharacterized protein LOC131854144 n=1 Tax=Achroia grisella TaxID=688607 RepID=UPI0027D2CB58|nr:uncharacterized protein LOC131854144 [Achroia grisella]